MFVGVCIAIVRYLLIQASAMKWSLGLRSIS